MLQAANVLPLCTLTLTLTIVYQLFVTPSMWFSIQFAYLVLKTGHQVLFTRFLTLGIRPS